MPKDNQSQKEASEAVSSSDPIQKEFTSPDIGDCHCSFTTQDGHYKTEHDVNTVRVEVYGIADLLCSFQCDAGLWIHDV